MLAVLNCQNFFLDIGHPEQKTHRQDTKKVHKIKCNISTYYLMTVCIFQHLPSVCYLHGI